MQNDKPWAWEIATVTIKRYDTQREAQIEEARRIRSKRPLHNVTHNDGSNQRVRRETIPRPDHSDAKRLRDIMRKLEKEVEFYRSLHESAAVVADTWKDLYQKECDAHDLLRANLPRVFVCEPTPRVLDPHVLSGSSRCSELRDRRSIWQRMRGAA